MSRGKKIQSMFCKLKIKSYFCSSVCGVVRLSV